MLRWIVVPLPYVRDGHPVATVSEVVAVLPGAVQEHSIYLDGGEGVPETGGSAPKRGFHTRQPAFRHMSLKFGGDWSRSRHADPAVFAPG